MQSSHYIDEKRRDYSLYILQSRSIPHLADGLKAAARRALWMAKDGGKYKTASLAGKTMPIHPHAECSGSINTLAAPYGNNIPLFEGQGAFGTLLNPTAYGAARYTSVKVSKFTEKAVFADMDLIPMMDNYDGTIQEPVHFLPLVPTVLLNPTSGIAVGFATNILPRSLSDLISAQIAILQGKKPKEAIPCFTPLGSQATKLDETSFLFTGQLKKVNTAIVNISALPYNSSHEKYCEFLDKLVDEGTIVDYEDNSRDKFDINVKFQRAALAQLSEQDLITTLKLSNKETENLTYIDIDGESVCTDSAADVIVKFTNWRLTWYLTRYQKLLQELQNEIQRYKDIITAINNKVGGIAVKVQNRAELIELLEALKIVHTDYIASFPVYRFTLEEKQKTQEKLEQALTLEQEYKKLIESEDLRKQVYINELKEINTSFK